MNIDIGSMLLISIFTTGFMVIISIVMFASDRDKRHAHVLEFWVAYGFYFLLSYFTQGFGPKVVALSTLGFIWRTRTIVCIMSDFCGKNLFRRWHYLVVSFGYALSFLLGLFDLPFKFFTLPAAISIFIVGMGALYTCTVGAAEDEITPLHRLFQFVIFIVYFHILDYPLVRYENAFTGLGFGIVLFTTVALAVIIPTLSVYELQRDRRRNLEGKLEERNQMLESQSKMSSLGEMTSSLVHEINNLLGILLARSEQVRRAISRRVAEDPELLKGIEHVISIINRMIKITQSLRLFSRDSKHEVFRQVHLQTIMDDVQSLAAERFLEGNVPLMLGRVPEVTVECKTVQIQQVFLNLLNNAFDAVQDLKSKWVRIDFELLPESVLVQVIDSGKGVPSDLREKIMEPFFTTKAVGKGTGLGLSISRSILQEHHGSLTIDAQALNTTFVVELPLKQPS